MSTTVRSFSKINLGLSIGPIRPDGFHSLTTLYQTLAAHDLVTLAAERLGAGERNRIVLASNDRRVPLDGRNTVWKMLERVLALEPFAGARWAVHATIEKRLPMQGGLGAGSANAAAALVALERETGLALPGGERLRIAAEVGSDVPLFLIGGAVLGLGRGEQVYPMPDLVPEQMPDLVPKKVTKKEPVAEPGLELDRGDRPGLPADPDPVDEGAGVEVVLALPALGVSTPQAFREWDRRVLERERERGQERERERGQGRGQQLAQGADATLTPGSTFGTMAELSRALAVSLCEPHHSSGVLPSVARRDLARHPLAALVRTGIENDFEQVVFRQHPLLGTIKRTLLGQALKAGTQAYELSASWSLPGISAGSRTRSGALYAALSGSGSALFGLYASSSEASDAEERLRLIGVASLRTRMLGRAAYWTQMFAAV